MRKGSRAENSIRGTVNRPGLDELRSIQFFSEMSNRDLRMVARFATTKKHGKGEIIIR